MSDVFESKSSEEIVFFDNLADELNFVETDAEVINADLISKFEEYLGETLSKGDERRLFLQGFAYVLADQLNHINETGRSNLLRYAVGNELDAIGELFHNARLEAQAATVTMRFTLSSSQKQSVIIPAGTRVSPDGVVFFATDEELVFLPNSVETSQEVSATATVMGSSHNDYPVDTINFLVDTQPYVASVTNVTVSGGGSDVETDEEYRTRLRESPFSFSVAGSANAYKAIAMSVSGDVSDVAVYSPSAGVVEIAVLKDGGEIPAAEDEIIKKILEACEAKNTRPLTDKVQVVPATSVNTDITLTYYVANGDTSANSNIENAINEYITWQTEKIGRDINPDKLNTLLFAAGAARVVITAPTYQALNENEIAQIGTVTINYGGSISM